MNKIVLRRGTSVPTTSKLTRIGEIAVNYSTGKVYVRASSKVVCINDGSSSTTTGGSKK